MSKPTSSINREAKKSILLFPVIVSESCDFEMTRQLARAIEIRNAGFTKTIIERIGVVDLKKNDSKDSLINKVKGYEFSLNENYAYVPGLTPLFETEEFDLRCIEDDGLNTKAINGRVITNEALSFDEQKELERIKKENENERIKNQAKADVTVNRIKLKQKNISDSGRMIADHGRDLGKSWANIQKRHNSLQPIPVEVNISYVIEGAIKDTKFTLGVKSPVHTVPSEEVQKFLPKAKFDMGLLIKLARLYTGEISFVKDFVLNLSEIKGNYDPAKAGKFGWYSKLKRLTSSNNLKRAMSLRGVMPTVSLVVSKEDVEEMYRETKGKFDLTNIATVKDMVESLSILNFFIVDEAREKIMVYEEGSDNGFEVISMSELREEGKSMSEKDLLRVMMMVNK
jgi:hypothetical protein